MSDQSPAAGTAAGEPPVMDDRYGGRPTVQRDGTAACDGHCSQRAWRALCTEGKVLMASTVLSFTWLGVVIGHGFW